MHCPQRKGTFRLARLVERFGADASLETVLYELSNGCRRQVPPGTKRRQYVPYCRAYYADLRDRPPPDELPPDAPPAAAGAPRLRMVG